MTYTKKDGTIINLEGWRLLSVEPPVAPVIGWRVVVVFHNGNSLWLSEHSTEADAKKELKSLRFDQKKVK